MTRLSAARDDHVGAGRRPGPPGRPRCERDRRIARLQRQLATLRAEPQTPERDRAIAAITSQVERLQRAEAATVRSAQLATVRLHVATPPVAQPANHGHGPLHGLASAAYWTAIGGVYALALRDPADRARVADLADRADGPPAARRRAAQPAVSLREDPERRLADRQLGELRVRRSRARRSATRRSARSRRGTSAAAADGADRAEAGARAARPHGACRGRSRRRRPSACSRRRCAPRPRTSRRTGTPARGTPWVDDLVAVNTAAAALHLVLRMERQCRRRGGLLGCHVGIVRTPADARKT